MENSMEYRQLTEFDGIWFWQGSLYMPGVHKPLNSAFTSISVFVQLPHS
jgi:hypothetical protein